MDNIKLSNTELIELAKQARLFAHAPYSEFKVGAAVLAEDGRVFTGCNIENSTYGLTMCAERVAIFNAVSSGGRDFAKVVVVADHERPAPPCGCCRQMIWEFSRDDARVILANLQDKVLEFDIKELFPLAFDATYLGA
jgi:cytidine deaminase